MEEKIGINVLTVLTPEIALTTVDFPCATCPIVPTLIVACLDITSGVKGDRIPKSRVARDCSFKPLPSSSSSSSS